MIGITYFSTLQTHHCLFRNTGKGVAFVIETSAPQAGMRLAAPTSRGLFFLHPRLIRPAGIRGFVGKLIAEKGAIHVQRGSRHRRHTETTKS